MCAHGAHGCVWQRGRIESECESVRGVCGRGYASHDEGEQTLNQLLACMDGIDSKQGKGVVRVSLSPLLSLSSPLSLALLLSRSPLPSLSLSLVSL